jgi:cholesterol transport system auxiliary component
MVFIDRFCCSLTLFALAGLGLGGCASVDKAARASTYDFGPGAMQALVSPSSALPALALAEMDASAALDSTAVLYRLAYADAQQPRAYAQARWTMTPAQLLRQRLRTHLGQSRSILNPGETAVGVKPVVLRIELEEFCQVFERADTSVGLVRLRATALQSTPQGERLLGQRNVVVSRPAPTADASGGVRALTAATDAALLEIDAWLKEMR